MKNTISLAFLVVAGVGITVIADILLKESLFTWNKGLIVGAFLYASTAVLVAGAFRLTSFGGVFTFWESATVIVGIVIAALRYDEPVTSTRILALSFALAAAVLSK